MEDFTPSEIRRVSVDGLILQILRVSWLVLCNFQQAFNLHIQHSDEFTTRSSRISVS